MPHITPLVSVLLPVYNAAPWLADCLDSLLAQTLPDFEIVAVDDGSTDESLPILQGYAARDGRIRLMPSAHVGVVQAAQLGLLACTGEFLARMDADDIALPARLQMQVALLRQEPHIQVASCLVQHLPIPNSPPSIGFARYIDWLNSLLTPEAIAKAIFRESPLPNPSTMVYRSELFALGGYVESGLPEDYELWLRYHHHGAKMAKVPQTLLLWRDPPTRLTRTDSRYSVENFLRCKADYLWKDVLANASGYWIWGAGQMGRRIAKQLQQRAPSPTPAPLLGFFDTNPHKFGKLQRGVPILPTEEVPTCWQRHANSVLLVAVASDSARAIIVRRLEHWGFVEARDFWVTA